MAMEEIILLQGPGYTIAQTSCAGTLVPYGPAVREDGNINHGWRDLRASPELVDNIPELSKSSGLKALVKAIAAPDSRIMSIGCECGIFKLPADTIDGYVWQAGGFVDVCFIDLESNKNPENFIAMSKEILSGIPANSEHSFSFEMMIEPLKSFFGHSGCHGLNIKPMGHAVTEDAAWVAFNYAANEVARVIVESRNWKF